MSDVNVMSAAAAVAQMKIHGAKKGLFYALGGGVLWGLTVLFLGTAFLFIDSRGITDSTFYMLPLVVAMFHDAAGGVFMLVFTLFNGKTKEYLRTMRTKPGWIICLATIFGGPLAMSGYLVGFMMAGTYAVAISACFPAVGAILAAIFLKEKINLRVWVGILTVVGGAVTISWVPPEGQFPNFYMGIGMALLATIGWAVEGVLGCFGMDVIDSDIALGIREMASGLIYALFVIPMFGAMVVTVASDVPVLFSIFGVGAFAGFAYLAYYKAINRAGVARGQSLYVTFSIWAILFSWAAGQTEPTVNLLIGAVLAVIGTFLIVGHPRELFSLRNV